MRVLVDTNVLVSILLRVSEGGAVHAIFEAIVSGELTLLLPDQFPLLVSLFPQSFMTRTMTTCWLMH